MTTTVPETNTPKKRPNAILRILASIVAVLVVLIAGFAGYAASLPDDFKVTRSAEIHAPVDAVFPLVDNFHEWTKWSPWENIDPNLKRTYEGSESGKGAVYAWEGNENVGAGKMTITESKPAELIAIQLEFFKPFAGDCPTTFKFEPNENKTKVTWTMQGKSHFFAKCISVFCSMDQMIGTSFEDGLKKLDTVASEAAKSAESASESTESEKK